MPTRGILSINGMPVVASSLSTAELTTFIFSKLKVPLTHNEDDGTGFIWRPEYLFEQIMIYMIDGRYEELRRVTRDHGLKYAVEELRVRLAAGNESNMSPRQDVPAVSNAVAVR